jgi:hypothetical protein
MGMKYSFSNQPNVIPHRRKAPVRNLLFLPVSSPSSNSPGF